MIPILGLKINKRKKITSFWFDMKKYDTGNR